MPRWAAKLVALEPVRVLAPVGHAGDGNAHRDAGAIRVPVVDVTFEVEAAVAFGASEPASVGFSQLRSSAQGLQCMLDQLFGQCHAASSLKVPDWQEDCLVNTSR